jgi:hypothetical protein
VDALAGSLTSAEIAIVESNVLSGTLSRTQHTVQQVRSDFDPERVRTTLLEMGDYNLEARDYVVGTMLKAYRPWGVELDPSSFSSLLEWENALVKMLP